MSVETLDGATILDFVNDEAAFDDAVRRRFAELDGDGDGFLSFEEMLRELRSLRVVELSDDTGPDGDDDEAVYRSLFERFDRDSDGAVGPEEYAAETREMMIAIGGGIGFGPVQMVLGHDSLLMRAVRREALAAEPRADHLLH